MDRAPSEAVQRLDADIRQALRRQDPSKLDRTEREALADLTQVLTDARIYSQSYELSETRQEQLKSAKAARKWLRRARKDILTASEANVFGAADVAQLSAEIEQIIANLK